jgi:MarR family transcriptional regulator, transcriptional regulator for hemolysin
VNRRASRPIKPGRSPKRAPHSAALQATAPAAAPAADDPARQAIRLSFLIHDVSRMRRTAYDQLMKPLGVTRAQWWVLAHLSRHDGMMQTKLADALEVGKASLGSLIDRLVAGGLVERRDDPADRRAKRVYMAKAGRQLLKRMMQEENQFNERTLGHLSPADSETMIRVLAHIKQILSAQFSSATEAEGD